MKATTNQVIQGAVNKIKELVSKEYKVLDNALDNDDYRGKLKIISKGSITIPNNTYEYTICSEKNKSFLFYGVNLTNTKLYRVVNGVLSEFYILTHTIVDYNKDKITIAKDDFKINDELLISESATIFIKDTVIPNVNLPTRKTQTPKCFELEFNIKTKDDANGKSADDVIDFLEYLFYSQLMRSIEFELSDSDGKLFKYNVMMKGDLTYFDSIEAKLNDKQKRIATATFYFFIIY